MGLSGDGNILSIISKFWRGGTPFVSVQRGAGALQPYTWTMPINTAPST